MKAKIAILLLVVPACLISCQLNNKTKSVITSFEGRDSCDQEPGHTYQVYIPATEEGCIELPLLIILDPHGNGKWALELFRTAADRYQCILAASNLIQNNYSGYIHSLNTLIQDIQTKYPTGKPVFLAGFSGGARMALNYAGHFPVDGILVSGGLAPQEELRATHCQIVALAGMADFNFIEAAQYIFNSSQAPENLAIEITMNGHKWPEANTLESAVGYLLYTQDTKEPCTDKKAMLRYVQAEKEQIEKLGKEDHYIQAAVKARNLAGSKQLGKIGEFTTLRDKLELSAAYISELDKLKESIRFELAVRNEYNQAMQSREASWWKKEINTLDQKLETDKDYYRRFAYQRIKGFIGILCYSLTNNRLRMNDWKDAERLLEIYRLAEPQNPDMFYFSALLAWKKGNKRTAREWLLKAKNAGFSDVTRVKSEFPEEEWAGIF